MLNARFRRPLLAGPALILLAATLLAQPAAAGADTAREDRWWGHVEALAGDDKEGRLTGSPGFDRAADYVIARFRALGLRPAGSDGFFQPVELVEQRFDYTAINASLVRGGATMPLSAPT